MSDIFSGIAAGAGALGSLITQGINTGINFQNYGLQREAYERSIRLQDLTMLREDTAAQRRMADLKASGLNPVLAAGATAQTSTPMRLEAPQNQARFTNPIHDYLGAYSQIASLKAQLDANQASIAKTQAETERTKAETARLNQQTPIETKGLELANQLNEGKLTGQALEQEGQRLDNVLSVYTMNDKIKQAELVTERYGLENLNIAVDKLLKEAQREYTIQLKAQSIQTVKQSQQNVLESQQSIKTSQTVAALNNLRSIEQTIKNTVAQLTARPIVQKEILDVAVKFAQFEVIKLDSIAKKLNIQFKTTGLSDIQEKALQALLDSALSMTK